MFQELHSSMPKGTTCPPAKFLLFWEALNKWLFKSLFFRGLYTRLLRRTIQESQTGQFQHRVAMFYHGDCGLLSLKRLGKCSQLMAGWKHTWLPFSGILQGPLSYANHDTTHSPSLSYSRLSQSSKFISRPTHMTPTYMPILLPAS